MRYADLGRTSHARLGGIALPVFVVMCHLLATMAGLMGAAWLPGPLLGWLVSVNLVATLIARVSEVPFAATILWTPLVARRGFDP